MFDETQTKLRESKAAKETIGIIERIYVDRRIH